MSKELAHTMASLKRRSTPGEQWGRRSNSKKIKTSLLGDDGVTCYDEPHDHFVLCGRGERTNRHPGNKAFRRVVESNREMYHTGPRRNKALIAESIVEAIYRQNPRGCFVRYDKESGVWIDIGTKEAIKKTSQALREDKNKKKAASLDRNEHKNKDDDNESTFSDDDDDQQEEDRKPSGGNYRYNGNYSGSGFPEFPAPVSYHNSEQGESEAMPLDGEFDEMIGNIHDVAAHEAEYEPLVHFDEPLNDFSRSSSEGSSNFPLPISSIFHQTSNGSSVLSIVSRESSDTEVDVLESGFAPQPLPVFSSVTAI